MGFNTTVLILNDGWDQIMKHPEEFVEKMNPLVSGGLYRSPGYRDDTFGVTFGVGNHCNNVQVATNEHADVHSLILSGGNYMTVIGKTFAGNRGHHDREDIKKSLNECLRDLGLKVIEAKKD